MARPRPDVLDRVHELRQHPGRVGGPHASGVAHPAALDPDVVLVARRERHEPGRRLLGRRACGVRVEARDRPIDAVDQSPDSFLGHEPAHVQASVPEDPGAHHLGREVGGGNDRRPGGDQLVAGSDHRPVRRRRRPGQLQERPVTQVDQAPLDLGIVQHAVGVGQRVDRVEHLALRHQHLAACEGSCGATSRARSHVTPLAARRGSDIVPTARGAFAGKLHAG